MLLDRRLFTYTLIATLALSLPSAFADENTPLPTAHTTRTIEGWTVRIDNRLLEGEHKLTGEQALKLLSARLVAITTVMPEQSLAKLRSVTIQLDLNHGKLTAMQYHPSAGRLKANGYSPELARCVHIPEVSDFLSPSENLRMPSVVLHELAHAFHDQTIGFDDRRVVAAWERFCKNETYKSVLTTLGHNRDHYRLTNPQEFFAEMTESYFGTNDFFPFVAGELQQTEPEIFALLADIWGPLPGFAQKSK